MIATTQTTNDRNREIQVIVALLAEADNTDDIQAVRRLTHAARLHLVEGFLDVRGSHG